MRKIKLKNEKRIQDLLFVIIVLVVAGMTIFGYLMIAEKLEEKISPKFNEEVAGSGDVFTTTTDIVNNTSDWAFVAIFVLMILSLIISSFLIYTHPVFAIVFIIMLMIFIVVSIYVANVYYEYSRIPEFANALANLPMTDWILTNLPLITLVLGVLSIIVIYSKFQGQNQSAI